ncbi:MAG: DUF6502 family protein [Gammaproteobacteria bacterium]|nr:DUF6502 family protein [Gammaproteobacteria bacterium]
MLLQALARILRPVVRVLLRHGITADACNDVVRRVYVDVAEREFQISGRKQTTARISLLTSINRKEVARLKKLPIVERQLLDEHHNRAARVISGWLRDATFLDSKGDPDTLPMEGERSFTELVKRHSGDVPPRAIADELQHVGAIEYTAHDELRLSARGYVPESGDAEKLQILGTDVRDLIETIDHNLTHAGAQARYQRKVQYDNIPVRHLDAFRHLSARLGQGVLEHLNEWLAERDRDAGNGSDGSGRVRLGLGIYQIEETYADTAPTDESKS